MHPMKSNKENHTIWICNTNSQVMMISQNNDVTWYKLPFTHDHRTYWLYSSVTGNETTISDNCNDRLILINKFIPYCFNYKPIGLRILSLKSFS